MYKKILIATDGSELAGKAVEHGVALAQTVGADVVVVTVTEMWSALDMSRETPKHAVQAIQSYEAHEAEHAHAILGAACALAKKAGVACEPSHIGDQRPAEGILQAAKMSEADLIVMATHGRRGVNRVLLGSQTNEVVTHSDIPVLVLR
ncbi:universal stress protein [Salipiger abyssi]|uniref:universal stress protein n=1 Tax=Salipiger abyssi TaxID=1250539 RepID=UPI001A8DEE8D|nr:universal stress protein [Salipiger abyssi]MBN9888147.1 universal stress protein [Salipiger abyssi]